MIMFWLIAITLIIFALFFILKPFRNEIKSNETAINPGALNPYVLNPDVLNLDVLNQEQQNIQIARERLSDLKTELKQGIISDAEYNQTRLELEHSLLNDIETPSVSNQLNNKQTTQRYNRYASWSLIFIIPVVSLSLYTFLGQPELLDGNKKQTSAAIPAGHPSVTDQSDPGSIEQMVEKLVDRLKQQPGNAEGWFMLGRTYISLGKYKEAVAALEKANQLAPDNPVIMLRYADALAMFNGGRISGQPFELIKKALELKPDDPTGLWLAGMGYQERGEYQKALAYWNLLLPLLKDPAAINEVKSLISKAKTKAGENIADSSTSNNSLAKPPLERSRFNGITVNVSFDKNQIKEVSENDTVFIFARAVNGPPMPLAVIRKQVKDLPLQVTLDDSMAMTPSMKLSSFKKVQVIARISKSGSAKSQSGDLQSATHNAIAGQKEQIDLIINKVLP